MKSLGNQIVAEMYGCSAEKLSDVEFITDAMMEAARRSACTIITQTFHHFSPHGVSGAIIIAESHLAIHTWPEHGYAAVDIFTCGDLSHPEEALKYLKEALGANQCSVTELLRGMLEMF
jgi:S-adenosylmethionine decarboxylase